MPTETLRPNAAGDKAFNDRFGAAENWDCVDETPSDDDVTYVNAAGAATSDLYNIPDSAIPAGATITQIEIFVNVKKVGVRVCNTQIGGKTNAAEFWTANIALTTSYVVKSKVWLLNPVTGVAWTKADIDALQIGVYLTFNIGSYGVCTQEWIIITYTVAVAGSVSIGNSVILAVSSIAEASSWIARNRRRKFIVTLK